jgi:hypothetical protein
MDYCCNRAFSLRCCWSRLAEYLRGAGQVVWLVLPQTHQETPIRFSWADRAKVGD